MTAPALTAPPPATHGRRWISPKRRIAARVWWMLGAVAVATIALMLAKLAGATWLSEHLSLEKLGPQIGGRLGHLFIVPIGALVVVLLRLTLNLQTLGPFRAILLAMAFESVGFGLGLAFFTIVTAVVMVLRPATRSLGLPYYGRVLTIISVVSAIVVAVLIIASATGAVDLERLVYFPIVVLALSGDTSSRLLAREGAWALLRRFGVTLLAAAAIALLAMTPAIHAGLTRFPELLTLPILAIIVICELFDIRLLRNAAAEAKAARKRSRRERRALAAATSAAPLTGPLRVAIVRNRSKRGVIGRLGKTIARAYSRKAVQRMLDALRAAGFDARVFDGDATLLTELTAFLPVDPETKRVRGIVLNLAAGVQGTWAATHVPAMLELAGVPYTGADPRGHATCLDHAFVRRTLEAAGIPTPAFVVHTAIGQPIGSLEFPLVVRPRSTLSKRGPRLVTNRSELDTAVAAVIVKSCPEAIVESAIDGRDFTVSLLGHAPMRTLPIIERTTTIDPTSGNAKPSKLCPAPIDGPLERRIRAMSVAAATACGARDIARVDIRLDRTGDPHVIQVHAAPSLGRAGALVRSAKRGGYGFGALLREVVLAACTRHGIDATSTVAAESGADRATDRPRPASR